MCNNHLLKHLKTLITKTETALYGSMAIILVVFLLWHYFAMPQSILQQPVSVVLEDRDGNLLGARVSSDEQWRFPHNKNVPPKFETAILVYEDKRFHYHPGIDPIALIRAAWLNIKNGTIVSGGSTITMQLARLLQGNTSRSFLQKTKEILIALRLETAYTKDELLALYCSYAPFGGNVVGLDAASWRYFAREPYYLSWAESATLAVMPNNPALVHPGRNREILKDKRDNLLLRLKEKNIIDSLTYTLSIEEPIPPNPINLPNHAPHLIERARKENPNLFIGKTQSRISSSLDRYLQIRVNEIVNTHSTRCAEGGINDMAAIIVSIPDNKILAYTGNSRPNIQRPGYHVDVLNSRRSPGSILKPFLYAAMISDGAIYPASLVSDIPTRFGSYSPRNFNRGFTGVMPAWQALARSLNVPAVRMLNLYSVDAFYQVLEKSGMTTLNNHPDHYGLSLVLGGSEVIPVEIAGMFGDMARQLLDATNNKTQTGSSGICSKPSYFLTATDNNDSQKASSIPSYSVFKDGAIWHTMEALLEVERPLSEQGWESYGIQQPVAWKTGTSFGFRDAWAIGMNTEYLVLVWAGNTDGMGVQGLTGIHVAAPVLFDIFRELPQAKWFEKPYNSMNPAQVCAISGYPPSEACPVIDTVWIPPANHKTHQCPYHRYVFLDKNEKYQVNAACERISNMKRTAWFVLPPAEAYYNKPLNASYKKLPPFRNDCIENNLNANDFIHIIYPDHNAKIEIPAQTKNNANIPVFELVHKNPETKIYWHLNDRYLGETQHFHQLPVYAEPGKYELIVIDEYGYSLRRAFQICE